jgi:hypothetical protein
MKEVEHTPVYVEASTDGYLSTYIVTRDPNRYKLIKVPLNNFDWSDRIEKKVEHYGVNFKPAMDKYPCHVEVDNTYRIVYIMSPAYYIISLACKTQARWRFPEQLRSRFGGDISSVAEALESRWNEISHQFILNALANNSYLMQYYLNRAIRLRFVGTNRIYADDLYIGRPNVLYLSIPSNGVFDPFIHCKDFYDDLKDSWFHFVGKKKEDSLSGENSRLISHPTRGGDFLLMMTGLDFSKSLGLTRYLNWDSASALRVLAGLAYDWTMPTLLLPSKNTPCFLVAKKDGSERAYSLTPGDEDEYFSQRMSTLSLWCSVWHKQLAENSNISLEELIEVLEGASLLSREEYYERNIG